MALEAVVYQSGLYGHYDGNKDLFSLHENWIRQDQSQELQDDDNNNNNDSSYQYDQDPCELSPLLMAPPWVTTPNSTKENDQCAATMPSTRPKRRRLRINKNKEEIESQRMTHIAVERNRRKQMSQYLSMIKSLMPDSYVQRNDQASIVGGAINYVKELERNLHSLSAQKTQMPFKEFLTFPQHSMMAEPTETSSRVADVEVTMVESHANLKIRSKKHPKQLLKLVSGLQSLRLTILHLNVSTIDQFALYSISVKVEEESKLNSMDEVADVVHQLMCRIHEEASLS